MKEELDEVEQPKDLEDSFRVLGKVLRDRAIFKDTLEANILGMTHFSLGMWLRNHWYLWWSKDLATKFADKNYPQEKPALVEYFNTVLNIHHADDMSSIIILSYHRHLNGKELKLEAQVKKYHDFWNKQDDSDGDNED